MYKVWWLWWRWWKRLPTYISTYFKMNEYNRYLVDPASGICLSQRLSHASLSMSYLVDETANGSVKQQ